MPLVSKEVGDWRFHRFNSGEVGARSARNQKIYCLLAIKHLPHMLDHAAARIEKDVVFSLEKRRTSLRLATLILLQKNLAAVITSKLNRINSRSYNHPSTVSMSLQFGYEIWKLADSKWESGRKIPSFHELISKCELPESPSVNSPRRSVDVREKASVNQQPVMPYQTPPPSETNAEGTSSDSSVQTSPCFSSVSSSLSLERSFEEDEEVHQASPGEQLAHQSNAAKSSSGSEDQCTSSPPPEERSVKSDKSPAKKRRRKARSDLAAHEKIIFSCGPRPATEHSAVELHPQNLLNKDLCLKKNTQCSQCGSKKTPEWRSGPTGSRTLCNACGLFFAKLTKKLGHDAASDHFLNLKKMGNVFDRRIGSI